ncbi:MAG TPA: hypothetical protein DIV79_03175 [Opitutae bacterium]|nr:hypothetical protein [Opitutaceae bacterium]HCR29001.1 hypothetical protein [Opitutae bacterium]
MARVLAVVSSILFFFLGNALVGTETGESGSFIVHRLDSPYQAGETTLRVLLPDRIEEGKRYPVLYILPVHEDGLFRHGDGLEEVRKAGYHNQHGLICVAPSFTSKPWFADHDLNPEKRDESHFLETVLAFVESHYPAQNSVEGRLLVGFSKSGWGVMSLLLRHPDVFHRVVGWDIGIRVDAGPIEESDRAQRIAREWGTAENFDQYRISSLIRSRGSALGEETRLFYYNVEGNRGPGGAIIHQLLVEAGVPHRYLYEPKREHRWDSGWLPEAVRFLVSASK